MPNYFSDYDTTVHFIDAEPPRARRWASARRLRHPQRRNRPATGISSNIACRRLNPGSRAQSADRLRPSGPTAWRRRA